MPEWFCVPEKRNCILQRNSAENEGQAARASVGISARAKGPKMAPEAFEIMEFTPLKWRLEPPNGAGPKVAEKGAQASEKIGSQTDKTRRPSPPTPAA
jgi:hypothetical protein